MQVEEAPLRLKFCSIETNEAGMSKPIPLRLTIFYRASLD
jgi:hypothetical protein